MKNKMNKILFYFSFYSCFFNNLKKGKYILILLFMHKLQSEQFLFYFHKPCQRGRNYKLLVEI